jgi:uncharacterized protein YggE
MAGSREGMPGGLAVPVEPGTLTVEASVEATYAVAP